MRNNEILLVASNLSTQQEIQGQISLNISALNIPGKFTSASDAITGEQIKLENNTLYLSMLPMRARLIWIK